MKDEPFTFGVLLLPLSDDLLLFAPADLKAFWRSLCSTWRQVLLVLDIAEFCPHSALRGAACIQGRDISLNIMGPSIEGPPPLEGFGPRERPWAQDLQLLTAQGSASPGRSPGGSPARGPGPAFGGPGGREGPGRGGPWPCGPFGERDDFGAVARGPLAEETHGEYLSVVHVARVRHVSPL